MGRDPKLLREEKQKSRLSQLRQNYTEAHHAHDALWLIAQRSSGCTVHAKLSTNEELERLLPDVDFDRIENILEPTLTDVGRANMKLQVSLF